MTDRERPDFLGIGAQKAGTTWLHRLLGGHPGVWLPPEKELHFFDERRHLADSGVLERLRGDSAPASRWRRQLRRQWKRIRGHEVDLATLGWYLRYFGRRCDAEWYRELFKDAGSRVCGEITPDYSTLSAEDVAWVRATIGPTKIIFFIRSPIERVWSHANMVQRMQGRRVAEVVEDLMNSPPAAQLSDYQQTIDLWSSVFGDDNFFIGQMEDISFAPRRLIDSVTEFLELPASSSYAGANRPVHSGGHSEIETSIAIQLAEYFVEPLENMARDIGGWTRWWLFATHQLIDDPPSSSTMPYPLWESELWDRWRSSKFGDVVKPLRSGSLPKVHRWTEEERRAVET